MNDTINLRFNHLKEYYQKLNNLINKGQSLYIGDPDLSKIKQEKIIVASEINSIILSHGEANEA